MYSGTKRSWWQDDRFAPLKVSCGADRGKLADFNCEKRCVCVRSGGQGVCRVRVRVRVRVGVRVRARESRTEWFGCGKVGAVVGEGTRQAG